MCGRDGFPILVRRRGKEDEMGSGTVQGPLWGARAREWAELAEPPQTPFYEAVFAEISVGAEPGRWMWGVGPVWRCSSRPSVARPWQAWMPRRA
jgi:hypothetical protein